MATLSLIVPPDDRESAVMGSLHGFEEGAI